MFDFLKKIIDPDTTENVQEKGADMLDDVSYIMEIKHIRGGDWHQYDVLLAAMMYGWEYMVACAAYMESADLADISTVTVSEAVGMPETELIHDLRRCGGKLKKFDKLSEERGVLAVGGISRVLKAPVKIVWFNQTRILRFFTPVGDEQLMTRYIETVIRRTFGTKDAMKLAKPVPKTDER